MLSMNRDGFITLARVSGNLPLKQIVKRKLIALQCLRISVAVHGSPGLPAEDFYMEGVMRFFTEHFFNEEQKADLLGGKYRVERERAEREEREASSRAIEIEQMLASLQQRQRKFDNDSEMVEMVALPLILVVTLALGFASSCLLHAVA